VRLGGSNQVGKRLWSVSELGAFYVQHRSTLVEYANRILSDRSKAEEIVQDALIKVILAAPELNDENHAIAYIRKTIQNLAVDLFRIEGRRPNLVLIDDVLAEKEVELQVRDDHADVVSAADDAAIVRQALSLLSPAERAALIMWEVEGRSVQEIARELGVKESAVRHTVSRARASMRRILSEFIIDEKRGLTALDLLSTSYTRSLELAKKSSKAAFSLFLLAFAYLGFTNFIDDSSTLYTVSSSSKSVSTEKVEQVPSLSETSSKKLDISANSTSTKVPEQSSSNAKAAPLSFLGLDKFGVPTGFTVTDSTGSLGSLYFSGKELLMSESGMMIPSLAKTSSLAANIFLNQTISQDASGTIYDAILSYGRKGTWVPLVSQVISSDVQRLVSGNYLLTAVIQVKSEVETTIVIPASADGRDLEVPPSRVITRILLNPAKTQILAQAVQVIEKVAK
jgi:RNA polymerase sigma factor (sigma-70 family)